MKTVLYVVLVLALTSPIVAIAQPPVDGTYTSIDLGGQMMLGRYSESWSAPDSRLQMGNTANKQSWDGSSLGAQWQLTCTRIGNPGILITDTVDGNGNGFQEWLVIYLGGTLVLDGAGPWGGGDPTYSADLHTYQEIKTYQYVNHEIVQTISNVSIQAKFVGYSETCVAISILNQEEHGTTDTEMLPPNYPGFLDPPQCDPTRTMGSWGEVDEITLIVTGCTVPVDETTWGNIKSIYK
jgi:hypothetical protein